MRQPGILEPSREGIIPDSLAAHGRVRGPARAHIAPQNGEEGMATSAHDPDQQRRTVKLLTAGADAELHLLRSERKAEKRLAEALASLASDEARLLRAQQRLERSRESVAAAEVALREVQARRAEGPTRPQD
jgi:hypothetical protein